MTTELREAVALAHWGPVTVKKEEEEEEEGEKGEEEGEEDGGISHTSDCLWITGC